MRLAIQIGWKSLLLAMTALIAYAASECTSALGAVVLSVFALGWFAFAVLTELDV